MQTSDRRHDWILTCLVAIGLVFATGPVPVAAAGEEKGEGKLVQFEGKEHSVGTADPDRALIYVLRPAKMGYAVKSYFFADRELLGINKGNSYFFASVEPGLHLFWSKSENVSPVEMEVEAGQTYYFHQKVKMGGFKARTRLLPLDEATGTDLLAKCKRHGTLTAEGRERGGRIGAEYSDRAQAKLAEQNGKSAGN